VTALLVLACGVLGLAVGSFLNVVIHRVPRRESVVSPRSRCPACESPLAPRDNIPVLSWLLLRGRCRSCRAPISVRYPLVELATGALFVAGALRFGASWELPAYLVLFASLLAITVIDLELYVIPNRIVYPTIAIALPLLALAAAAQHRWEPLQHALIGGAGAWTVLFAAHVLSGGRGMGFGDVRLAFVLGLFLGWLDPHPYGHVFLGLFLGFALGSVVGLVLMALRLRGRKDAIPFGPFLAGGTVIAIFVGSPLLRAYFGQ
jgi:leader peptidase (prepilin peptidase)/N-methyltransferase